MDTMAETSRAIREATQEITEATQAMPSAILPTREEWTQTLIQRHGPRLQGIFARSTVAICGLGGLGSNIAVALARAGVGKLILIDYDRVDLSNLHRQQYKVSQIGRYKTEALAENLGEIAPYLSVVTYTRCITEEDFASASTRETLSQADVICEAFDSAEAKAMLAGGVLETMPDTYLVAASGMAGLGSPNAIHTRRVMKRFYLCGDEVSDVALENEGLCGLLAPRVMLCAAHQAQTVLRILAGEYEL